MSAPFDFAAEAKAKARNEERLGGYAEDGLPVVNHPARVRKANIDVQCLLIFDAARYAARNGQEKNSPDLPDGSFEFYELALMLEAHRAGTAQGLEDLADMEE